MLSRLATPLPILVILGCAGQPPAPPAVAAPPPPVAPSASADAPAPGEPPSAQVTAVGPSKESMAYSRVKIVFTNPSKRACRFVGYKLSWGAAHKDIKLDAFSVPAGETRERWLRIDPSDGDLRALTPDGSRVDVLVECDAS